MQRFYAVFDFLDGDGVAESQVTLALRPEHRAGNGCDVRLIKQNLRRSAAVLVNLFNVWKRVKSARGRFA